MLIGGTFLPTLRCSGNKIQININQYNGTQFDRTRYYVDCFYKFDSINELEFY